MKAEHRHELKTNELADWIANFPQWFKENQLTVIIGAILVLGLIAYTIFFYHRENRIWDEKQARATSLLEQLRWEKQTVIQGKQQGLGVSDLFLNTASALQTAGSETQNEIQAALILIKRAEVLRTELHYRPTIANPNDRKSQLQQAQQLCDQAVEKAKGDPTIMAMAEFGKGLCLEDMGDFAGAQKIYEKIIAVPEYKGTSYVSRAQLRLDTMKDNEQKVQFTKSEKPQASQRQEIKRLGPLLLEGPIAQPNKPAGKKPESNSAPKKK